MAEVTMENMLKAIEIWNAQNAGKKLKGQLNIGMREMIEAASIMADASWQIVHFGNLAGHRFAKTIHGILLQAPQPSNEVSLLPESTARAMGLAV